MRSLIQIALVVCTVLILDRVASAQCTLSTVNPSVTICIPANNATIANPVHIVAGTTDSKAVNLMQVYVDGIKKYEVTTPTLDTNLTMIAGTRRVTVQARDSALVWFKATVSVNVTNSTPTVAVVISPASATIVPNGTQNFTATVTNSTDTTVTWSATCGAVTGTANTVTYTAPNTNGACGVTATSVADNTKSATASVTVQGPQPGLSNINHIIYMLQENRSFDSYFGRMGQYRRNQGLNDPFDELPLNVAPLDRSGVPVSPFHFQTVCHENLSPAWNESHYDVHGGLMDNFMLTTGSVPSTIDPDGTRAMGYYDWTDLPYYYELAFQFGTSDRWFSPVLTATPSNRMYTFAATSLGTIRGVTPPSGGWTNPTIFDRLNAAGVSWRYYYIDSADQDLKKWATYFTNTNKVFPLSQYFIDVQNDNTLPQVVFIERGGQLQLDEHPGVNIQKGAANTKQIIDALMAGGAWPSSAFILSFDEGGGLYDHVPPATVPAPDALSPNLQTGDLRGSFTQSGFRIPLIVISPWSKTHLVSHVVRDSTAILKLIETRFGLSALTARDAWADDMTEFFDFSAPTFVTPPALPAQPTTGTCRFGLEKAPGH